MKTRTKVKNALSTVSDMMVGDLGGEESKFWHIISALRGPDLDSHVIYKLSETETIYADQLKEAVTAVIRYNLGLFQDNSGGCIVRTDTEEFAEIRRKFNKGGHDICRHFLSHSRLAFEALDLKWDEVNPDLQGEISYKV